LVVGSDDVRPERFDPDRVTTLSNVRVGTMTEPSRYTARLYASLSEPRPILGMDWRFCVVSGVCMVATVVAIPFGGAICYAPSLAFALACVGVARLGKNLWAQSPYFVDEYGAHVSKPSAGGADEKTWTF
jgi:hypothetical protein